MAGVDQPLHLPQDRHCGRIGVYSALVSAFNGGHEDLLAPNGVSLHGLAYGGAGLKTCMEAKIQNFLGKLD